LTSKPKRKRRTKAEMEAARAEQSIERKEKLSGVPAGVVDDFKDLRSYVDRALVEKVPQLLVTKEVLKQAIGPRYESERDYSMMFYNVMLVDYQRVSDAELKEAEKAEEVLFGGSKVKIGNNAIQNASQPE